MSSIKGHVIRIELDKIVRIHIYGCFVKTKFNSLCVTRRLSSHFHVFDDLLARNMSVSSTKFVYQVINIDDLIKLSFGIAGWLRLRIVIQDGIKRLLKLVFEIDINYYVSVLFCRNPNK